MAENRIQYSSRNFEDFRNSILDITKKYYPDLSDSYSDSSIGSWFIDIFADVADAINYHIDRVYQETSVTAAGQRKSLLNIARNNGLKVPGKKAAVVEIELSCELPLNTQGNTSTGNLSEADESYAPFVKRGTLFSTGTVTFELVNDVNFKEQFDENGISNRQIIPQRDSNGNIISYLYKKLAIAVAGQSKVFKKIVTSSDIKPFMSVLLQDSNILGVESILVKQGVDLSSDPNVAEYNVDEESFVYGSSDNPPTNRYFEVDNLADQYRFGYESQEASYIVNDKEYVKWNPVWDTIEEESFLEDEQGIYVKYKHFINQDSNYVIEYLKEDEIENLDDKEYVPFDQDKKYSKVYIPISRCVRGKWKRLKNKFTTEFTDNQSLKITFGTGIRNQYGEIPSDSTQFTQYVMSRMMANDYMGVLPETNTTMYILYRVGGGEMSNIAKGTLTNITNLSMSIEGNCDDAADARKKRDVQKSLSVTNTTPSYGGKDEPSDEELRQLIKYNNSAQNRCVTLHDYVVRINELPSKYGTPFRCGAVEENNKIVIYTFGLDSEGHLASKLSEYVANNIKEYLSGYKMINDFIEIRSGKIINVAFDIDLFIDKTYDKSEVTKRVIDLVRDYMDIRNWLPGNEIFIGDIEKEISKLDGVKNLIDLRVYNKVGTENGYSSDETTQELVSVEECCYDNYDQDISFDRMIDLKASNKILFTDSNSMIEIKYPNRDIRVHVKER